MSLVTYHYPLDLSGESANNLVLAEPHALGTNRDRAVVLNHGPFFATNRLVVRDSATNEVLIKGQDYKALQMLPDATARSGKLVCAVIYVTNPSVNAISVDYQSLGGDVSGYNQRILEMIEALQLDNRAVYWGQIVGKPERYLPATHLHDIADWYGFEYLIAATYAVRDAILIGDAAAHVEIMDHINRIRAELIQMFGGIGDVVDDHVQDLNNPHQTNKTHVGLGNVQNYGIATQAEAVAGTSSSTYMTPERVAQAIAQRLADVGVAEHISNMNNPHNTTKTHVGLGSVQNYGVATVAEARAATATNKYMTPALVREAIEATASADLSAHISSMNNPHGTTAGQVGLGNVQNYGVATVAEARAGTATNKYMTPALVREAITTLAGDVLSAHTSNMNNPHGTTAAQVGLGNVQNYGVATVTEAREGTVTNKYMTPALVREAISAYAGADLTQLSSHVSNMNNPHGTTKAHVGLGSVLNYGMASQGEATDGSSNEKYMSPLRVRQAITAIAYDPLLAMINQRIVAGSNATLASLSIGQGYIYADGADLLVRANGNRYFRFGSDGNFYALSGRIVGSNGFQPSDARLKRDIEPVVQRPIWRDLDYCTWNMIATGETGRGFIAQDVFKTAPEYTTPIVTDDGRNMLAVDYTSIAVEMAYAAGREVDRLSMENRSLREQVGKLTAFCVRVAEELDVDLENIN